MSQTTKKDLTFESKAFSNGGTLAAQKADLHMTEILSWGIPLTAIVAFITFAFMVLQFGELSADDFWLARGFLLLAFITGLGRITLWALTTSRPPTVRVLVGIIAWGLIAPIGVEAIRYVNRKYARWTQRQSTQTPSPLPKAREELPLPKAAEVPHDRPASVDASGRIILDVTPEYLGGIFQTHTGVQANKLIEIYKGKWLRASGAVRNVAEFQDASVVVYLTSGSFIVAAEFIEQRWIDYVVTLRRGAIINVIGKLQNVDSACTTWLKECELVN